MVGGLITIAGVAEGWGRGPPGWNVLEDIEGLVMVFVDDLKFSKIPDVPHSSLRSPGNLSFLPQVSLVFQTTHQVIEKL